MELNPEVLLRYGVAQVYKEHQARSVNSVSFHADGIFFATANDAGNLALYNAEHGTQVKVVHSKQLGCGLLNFTHHESCVVFASTLASDHAIRYLSFHDNKFLRMFRGHKAKITSVAMSPVDDRMLSASADGQMRLWDLRENVCQGKLDLAAKTRVCVAFDPAGMVFSVAAGREVRMYDAREYSKGPFETFRPELSESSDGDLRTIVDLKFSPDGKYVLAGTDGNSSVCMDSFDGGVAHRLPTYSSFGESASSTGASGAADHHTKPTAFTCNGRFVLSCGSEDCTSLSVYHIEDDSTAGEGSVQQVAKWNVNMPDPVTALAWSPITELAVVCSRSMTTLWLPAEPG